MHLQCHAGRPPKGADAPATCTHSASPTPLGPAHTCPATGQPKPALVADTPRFQPYCISTQQHNGAKVQNLALPTHVHCNLQPQAHHSGAATRGGCCQQTERRQQWAAKTKAAQIQQRGVNKQTSGHTVAHCSTLQHTAAQATACAHMYTHHRGAITPRLDYSLV